MKRNWLKRRWTDPARFLAATAVLTISLAVPAALCAEDLLGVQPLLSLPVSQIASRLPSGTQALFSASAIEQFLDRVDRVPPDWKAVYGHGHHDPAHDERLFTLNRERDAKREGNEAVLQRIAFVWSGELSGYDAEHGGFRVALGPQFTPTSWGVVRFKCEEVPGNLVAVPTPVQRDHLLQRRKPEHPIDIDVIMVGRLIPDESIVYDFSHDEAGVGLIMPVVQVEAVFYLHPPAH